MNTCRICGQSGDSETFAVREMMFGSGEEFVYFQCASCRCVQIREIPSDMSRHYPANYYSLNANLVCARGALEQALCSLESRVRLRMTNRLFGLSRRTRIFEWMRGTKADYQTSILDVGCGSGKLLHELRMFGFRDLTGADPFIAATLRYDNGIVIHKSELSAITQTFDLIMMHHTFEHVALPQETLVAAHERLRPRGYLLLRLPLADSHAFRHYGVNWFAWDAPRHFYLHTPTSIQLLAKQTGFTVEKVEFDSGAHQFWGSEQYARGIPHRSPNSHEDNPSGSIFSRRQIREYERLSRDLNRQQQGDAACFYLRRLRP